MGSHKIKKVSCGPSKTFYPQGTTPAERIFATQPKEATAARDPRNTEKKRELHSLAKAEDNIKETRRHNVRSRLDSQTTRRINKKTDISR